jgi:PAS domain-containing protein
LRGLLLRLMDGCRTLRPHRQGTRPSQAPGGLPGSLLGKASNAVLEGSVVTDTAQKIVYANAAFTALTGWDPETGSGTATKPGYGSLSPHPTGLLVNLSQIEALPMPSAQRDGDNFYSACIAQKAEPLLAASRQPGFPPN